MGNSKSETIGFYNQEEGKKLLVLARKCIESSFSGVKVELPKETKFKQSRGVFVTLKRIRGGLRGCMGFPYPSESKGVAELISEAALMAAFKDPRFKPLSEKELDEVSIEISVLTQPQETKPQEIIVGTDGIIGEYLVYGGLLLPQVATENKMDRIGFLEALCIKSGLPRDAWQKKGFKLWKFQNQIFEE